jgi:hypothetical protein
VELYTRKYEGFMIGLDKIDLKTINAEYTEFYLTRIPVYEADFAHKDLKQFQCLLAILRKLCEIAKGGNKQQQLETLIKEKEETIKSNTMTIEETESILS